MGETGTMKEMGRGTSEARVDEGCCIITGKMTLERLGHYWRGEEFWIGCISRWLSLACFCARKGVNENLIDREV